MADANVVFNGGSRTSRDGDGTTMRGLPQRHGQHILTGRRLGELIRRRPVGATANQWNTALRTRFDFAVCAAGDAVPVFAVEFVAAGVGGHLRTRRMTDAVCAAAGLPVLRVETEAPLAVRGRQIVEYLIDARAFAAATTAETADDADGPEPATGFREIVGRLPDGRQGYVNDLGILTRLAVMEAYVAGQVADPIVRGLHLSWADGTAEGWAWAELGARRCLFERVRLSSAGFACGLPLDQFAEDLAVAAIGDRLRALETDRAAVRPRAEVARLFDELRERGDEIRDGARLAHIRFD